MTGPVFSIIIAIYNTQDYLDEAIESVLNQDFDFKRYIQLILVDDGSTDRSYEICLKYQKQYPDNVILLKKENNGPASARNMGLEYATGEFVNFLDSDDKLSANALSQVMEFFKKYDTDLVTVPIEYFGAKTGNQYMNYRFKQSGLINLDETFNCPHFSASTSFIRRQSIKDIRFSENLANGEDLLFVNQILLDKLNYGVLNTAKYYYRKRENDDSLMDKAFTSNEYFTPKLKHCFKRLVDYSIKTKGSVPKFIQYTIVQDLHGVIRSDKFGDFVKNREDFFHYLNYILDFIDDDVILSQRKLDEHAKSFLLFVKNGEFHIETGKNTVSLKTANHTINNTHNNKIRITDIDVANKTVNLSGYVLSCCYNSDLVVKCNELEYSYDENNPVLSFAGIDWLFKAEFEFELPFENELQISIRLIYDGITLNNRIIADESDVKLKDNIIIITDSSFKSKVKKVLNW